MPPRRDVEDSRVQNYESPFPYNLFFFHVSRPYNVTSGAEQSVFTRRPWCGPLLFENSSSDARDHCANERNFLSYLRLSVYMSVVSIAVVTSFHLKAQPSALELRMARPLGIVFWVLSLLCLCLGVGNYVKTVNKYGGQVAIVQTGWKTQSLLSLIAIAIVGVCIVFLATKSQK